MFFETARKLKKKNMRTHLSLKNVKMILFIEFAPKFNLEWMVIRLIAFKATPRARKPFVERKSLI